MAEEIMKRYQCLLMFVPQTRVVYFNHVERAIFVLVMVERLFNKKCSTNYDVILLLIVCFMCLALAMPNSHAPRIFFPMNGVG